MDGDLRLDDFTTDLLDDEPRIEDWKLAQALGFARDFAIHQLIERHRTSLEQLGNLPHRVGNSRSAGRPGRTYQLNFNQAIFVAIKSDAPNAVPVQIHVVTIYGLWAHGKLAPVDPETAIRIEDATERAFDASPAFMRLLSETRTDQKVIRSLLTDMLIDLWRFFKRDEDAIQAWIAGTEKRASRTASSGRRPPLVDPKPN